MKRGKKYVEAAKTIDRGTLYDVADAVSLVKKTATAKFDETIEAHIRTGCDGRHADQQIRGAVVLPHGTGKKVRILVFAKDAKAEEAKAAGADFVGGEELIPKIQNENWFEFDVVVATPDMMGVVGRLGRVLGPKGLMPNPKAGTVTMDVTKAIQEIKAGKIEYRLDKTNIIHVPVGKASFTEEQLTDNFQTLIDAIVAGKIKGIAAIVGCSNLRAKGHDVFTVELAKELIKKDILVLSAGCTCGGLENCGLMTMEAVELCGEGLKEICTALGVPPVLNFGPCLAIGRIEMAACALAKELNVDLPQLPVVISAPQWLEEQALADGAYALALGFPLHLALSPFVTGSQVAVNVLTEGLKDLTGGQLIIETEVEDAAQKFEEIIKEKRIGLGIDKGGDAVC